ncbi:MAG: hypothetical protein A2521_09270 [Deltaproteobacteria bacterium RIFOXYD12_FULL_57_12]|nr:MAG: hypothetical protein A2521_09270 [Deltaproteobacteria bacterium RIFOXYD12_FULL_57_12]
MDFKIIKQNELPYYQVELSLKFNLQDLEKCYLEIINHPNWVPGLNIIWDARKCTFDHLRAVELNAIAEMTAKYKEQRGAGLATWVVGRDVDFGIARMFQMLSEDKVIFEFCVFRTIQEAQDCISRANQNT